eukprot:1126261-Amphidinium_carterae.2
MSVMGNGSSIIGEGCECMNWAVEVLICVEPIFNLDFRKPLIVAPNCFLAACCVRTASLHAHNTCGEEKLEKYQQKKKLRLNTLPCNTRQCKVKRQLQNILCNPCYHQRFGWGSQAPPLN